MVNAVVLAGDKNGGIVSEGDTKALIKINDKFMIEYVIDSLRGAECVDKIIVVGSDSLLNTPIMEKVNVVIENDGSIMQNIRKALKYIDNYNHVIVCTSDIPMVFSEAIEDFVAQCKAKDVDIGYPIIEKSLNDQKYPDAKRTYVKLKDGMYTGGNIIYINPDTVDRCFAIAEELVENRKNPLKMGRVLGPGVLIKLALGTLKIEDVEKRVKKLFGINARAIKTPFPEMGNDVDKIEDVNFINRYMNIGV